MSDDAVVLALTTFGDAASAERVVRALVDRRVIACGTLLPGARSIYRWQGAVEEATEVVVVLKTTRAAVGALKAVLPALHPYEVPELLVVEVADGLAGYLRWVGGAVDG